MISAICVEAEWLRAAHYSWRCICVNSCPVHRFTFTKEYTVWNNGIYMQYLAVYLLVKFCQNAYKCIHLSNDYVNSRVYIQL